MALVVKDRVRVSSITAGTGTLTLGAAITGFQDFSVIGNGNTTYYTIVDPTTGAWEVGIGTYNSTGPTLSRDTVLESSNAGSLVSFLSNPKDVFVTYPAERSVYVEGTAIVPATTARLAFSNLTQGSALSVLGVSGNAAADVASIAAASDHQVLRRSGTTVAFGAVALNQANAITGTLPVGNGGTGVTTSTGSGSVVLSTSPTLTTPNLGTPSAATLTNATGLPINAGTTGTLDVNRGGTGQTSYVNGELLIGNTTGNTLTKSTLTAGTAISVTNGTGSITIANTGVTSLAGTANQVTVSASTGGVTLSLPSSINVNTTGSAATLTTARTIWGQNFNGSANVSGALSGATTISMSGQLTNTVAIGTAPFVITSTTRVANLNVATAGTADTLTTSRTLWGQSFNGSGNVTGALSSVTTIGMSGQLTSTVAVGTAPFVITSTTRVANLNVATAGTADTLAVTDDTTTNATYYPTFSVGTSGNQAQKVASTELQFNPSTGTLLAQQMNASNGIFINSQTVSADYTIPSGSNAMSVDATIASGVTVTVSSGSTWVIL